jgi:hypothetical protein
LVAPVATHRPWNTACHSDDHATRLRTVALIAHATAAVAWLGAVAGFLTLAVAGLTSHSGGTSWSKRVAR